MYAVVLFFLNKKKKRQSLTSATGGVALIMHTVHHIYHCMKRERERVEGARDSARDWRPEVPFHVVRNHPSPLVFHILPLRHQDDWSSMELSVMFFERPFPIIYIDSENG